MSALLSLPAFSLVLSLAAYAAGVYIRKKTGLTAANPLAIATLLVIAFIGLTPLDLATYLAGTQPITLFLVPVTVILALKIYRQWRIFRANLAPILAGCAAGCLVSVSSVYGLCRLFELDGVLTRSLLPKSVTSAIAMELAEKTGGLAAVAVAGVIFTGMVCAVAAPPLMRLFGLKNRVALGVALGASGHALGTAKAIEIGEAEGALSGIALTLSGLITSLLYLFIF